jgi:hypothetical protein
MEKLLLQWPGFKVVKRWRLKYGTAPKEMEILENAEGMIKVPDSIYRVPQPKTGRFESYHDTRDEAISYWLADSRENVAQAKKNLRSAEASLKRLEKRIAL